MFIFFVTFQLQNSSLKSKNGYLIKKKKLFEDVRRKIKETQKVWEPALVGDFMKSEWKNLELHDNANFDLEIFVRNEKS